MAKHGHITPAFRLIEPFAPLHRPDAEIPMGTIVHQALDGSGQRPGRHGGLMSVSMDPKGSFPTFLIPADLLEPHDMPTPGLKALPADLVLRTHKDFALEHGANLMSGLSRLFVTIQKIQGIKGVSPAEFSNDVRSVMGLAFAFNRRLQRALAFGFGPDQVIASHDDSEERVFLIKKGGFWWREGRFGYTDNKHEAGRFTKAEADLEAEIEPLHMRAIHQDDVSDDGPGAAIQELQAQVGFYRAERQALLDTDRWASDVRTTQARDAGARLAWHTLITQFRSLGSSYVAEDRINDFNDELDRLAGFDIAHLEAMDMVKGEAGL